MRKLILAAIVGILVGLVTYFAGLISVDVALVTIGNFLKSVSVLAGVLAGVWFYFTRP